MSTQNEHIPRILIVDDEKIFRSVTAQTMAEEGFEVTEASNGSEAMTYIHEQSFNIALLDIRMEEFDGLETLKYIRKHSPDTECMILTGYAEIGIALSAMKFGAREFLTKPISNEELIQRVKSVWNAHLAEMRLKDIQTRFNSQILNDLLTPLNSIKRAVDHISRSDARSGQEKHESVFQTIMTTIADMETMLNDMIDLTMYEADRVGIERVPTNFDELVPAVCTQYNSRITEHKINFKVDVSPEISTIEVDPEKIQRVMKHLMENALDHTPRGGSIVIHVSPTSQICNGKMTECVEVSITDSRAQVLKGELLLVFDKYKDVLTHRHTDASINGLRLPICKSIIEAHNGTISAESEEGKGCTFTFCIPIEQ